ncbi:MAG: hypothetical protein ACKODC_10260 [Limnohabitans sp.]
MSAPVAALLADALRVLHACIVVFVGAYSVFAVLVALAWWLVRPHPHHLR